MGDGARLIAVGTENISIPVDVSDVRRDLLRGGERHVPESAFPGHVKSWLAIAGDVSPDDQVGHIAPPGMGFECAWEAECGEPALMQPEATERTDCRESAGNVAVVIDPERVGKRGSLG